MATVITKVTLQINQQLAEETFVSQAHPSLFSSLDPEGPSTSHHGNDPVATFHAFLAEA